MISTAFGTPAPIWPAVPGSNNDDLAWTAINGASGYKVATCTPTSNATFLPTMLQLTTFATTYSYSPSVNNNKASCITVTATNIDVAATNGITDSLASSTKCVSRSGGTYTHY